MIRALAILFLSACAALAASVRVSWALVQAQVGVNYRVCRVVGASLFIRQKTNQ